MRTWVWTVFACALTTTLLSASSFAASAVGKPMVDFTLKSQFGKDHSLKSLREEKLVVVVFMGTECPLVKLYAPRLQEIASKYRDRVSLVGIDANQQDSLQEIQAFAQRNQIEFPILKDPGNKVAEQFGAMRTPEAFVLDREGVVRYHGRIDDQYGLTEVGGYQKPSATTHDLTDAIDHLLNGQTVLASETEVAGCLIGKVRPVRASEVTYSKQISRVFQSHCVECHRPGQIGPFDMTSYEDLAGWGEMIREVVTQGRMPPWHANPAHGSFRNDLRLSDEEKSQITEWVDAGCPEGDPSDLPKPRSFVDGWVIGEPDQVVKMRDKPVKVPAEGVVDYYHFVVDPGWTEDKWIMAAEAKPGSPECVHHILVFMQPPDDDRGNAGNQGGADGNDRRRPGNGRGVGGGRPGGGLAGGNLIAGYAPGMNPLFESDGATAVRVKAGSKLIFQLHYTPNGTPHEDLSYVGFRFAKPEEVKYEARSTSIINFFFVIPPGAENHEASSETVFDYDTNLTCMTPHMHTRGKAFRYEVTYPNGDKEILLDVPAYDFNWQTSYHLKEPKMIPKGTKLVCTAHWDNSEKNLSNPDPTKRVTWGEQTWQEMMIGFYVEVFPKGQVPERPSPLRSLAEMDPAKIFDQMDSDKDGKLSKDELPDRIGERIVMADTDRDGALSKDELARMLKLINALRNRARE